MPFVRIPAYVRTRAVSACTIVGGRRAARHPSTPQYADIPAPTPQQRHTPPAEISGHRPVDVFTRRRTDTLPHDTLTA